MEITVENVNEIMKTRTISDDPAALKDQARAWVTLYDLCEQLGMDFDEQGISGLQRVVKFIIKKS